MPLVIGPIDQDRVKFYSKACVACHEVKLLDDFYGHPKMADKRQSICKACSYKRHKAWCEANRARKNEYQRAYRQRYPEKVRAQLDAWLKAHPEYEPARYAKRYADPKQRVRMLAANKLHRFRKRANGGRGVTVDQMLDLLSKPCAYCGAEATEIDHVLPVSRGGEHDINNVAPACRSCNASKGARTPEEWRASRKVA